MDVNRRPMYKLVQNYNLTEKRLGEVYFGDIKLPNKEAVEVEKYN